MLVQEDAGDAIAFTEEGGVSVITLNRPAQLNTFRHIDYVRFLELLERVHQSSARVLILTAVGRAFSAGQDLTELDTNALVKKDDQAVILQRFQEITRKITLLNIPTIAAFNGFAVGAGLEMALACDFRIAVPHAYFLFAEAQRGLFPTNGVLWLLPRLIGISRAKEMLLFARKFDAEYALTAGLINEIVTEDKLAGRAMEMAVALADNAPFTIAGIKTLLRSTYDITLDEMMEKEIDYNMRAVESDDFAEGVSSFLEKRKPDFNR